MIVENAVTESSTEAEPSAVTETAEESAGQPEGIWVLMKVGADGVPQVAPGYEHIKPQSGQMYNCSELADGLYNCTVVDGPLTPKGNCSIVTSDLSEIQKCIEATGGATGPTQPATIPGGSVQPEPSAPAGSVVGEAQDSTSTFLTSIFTF